MGVNHSWLRHQKELVLVLGKMNLNTKFDKNRMQNGSAIDDTSLRVS